MARPNKVGIEYFSLDVKMDDEVELIKAEHGMKGFGILISMFQTIYADKGYYRKWNERNQILFSKKVAVDRNEVASIISDCIKWDIFDQEKYEEYNILTSKRIQKQYIGATYKRSTVKLYQEYLLVEDTDRENIRCIPVSDNGNSDTSGVSDSKSTQSNKDKDKEKNKESNSVCEWPTDLKKENGQYQYPDKFEKLWQEYPDRDRDAKFSAYKQVRSRIKNDNEDYDDLLKSAQNFNKYQQSKDNIGTSFVPMAKTFFGASQKQYLDFIEYDDSINCDTGKITDSVVC